MLSNQPIKIKTGTTRGVVLITLLLSLVAFTGVDSRGSSREVRSVKTELVVKTNRYAARATVYKIAGQKGIFNFYPFGEIEFLSFHDNQTKTKMAVMVRQNLDIEKLFNRYTLRYPSLSVEEDIIESLPG